GVIKNPKINGRACEDEAININPNIPIKFQTSIDNYIPGVRFHYRWQISNLKKPVTSCPYDLSQSSVLAQLDMDEMGPDWSIIGIFLSGTCHRWSRLSAARASNGIYILRVKSYRDGSPTNYGFKLLYLMINTAPDVSLLSVRAFPTVGEALNTRFQLTCDGATDSDGSLKYNIGYSQLENPSGPDDCIPIEIGANECKLSQATMLPSGAQKRDYMITICIEVFDAAMASSFYNISTLLRVKERQMSIDELSNGNIYNRIEGSAYGGNSREMGKAAFPAINSLSTVTVDTPAQVQEMILFKRKVVNLISKCVNASDSNTTTDNRLRDLEFQSKMLSTITEGELDEDSLDVVAETAKNMAKNLLEISQQRGVSYHEVLASVNRLVTSSESITSSLNNAEQNGAGNQDKSSNKLKLGNKQLGNYITAADSLANKMVTDERETHISTPNISIVVVKRQPSKLNNAKLKASGSTGCDNFKLGDFKDSYGSSLLVEPDPRNPNTTVPSQSALTKLPLPATTMCSAPSNASDSSSGSEFRQEPCNCRNSTLGWFCSPLTDYNGTSVPAGPDYKLTNCMCNSTWCSPNSDLDSKDNCEKSNSYQPDLWTCYLSVDDLNTREVEKTVHFGIRAIKLDVDGKPSVKTIDGDSSSGNSENSKIPEYQYLSMDFKSTAFTAGCYYFDTNSSQFSNIGVHVGQCSTPTETQCFSSHMTSFMSSFYVPPLAFNPSDSGWLKLDSNPIALSVVLALVCFYLIIVVWVRRKDKDDMKKVGVTPLPDNHPADEFRYELTFWTGARRHAGTTAQVSFSLIGEDSESEARPVLDPKRPVLQTGCVDSFFMTTPSYLGRLTHARIWHDNAGSDPKWYFNRLLVEDLQTGDKYFFICNRWFAFDEDDGMVDRILPVSGMEEVRKFEVVFWSKAQKNLNDGHLWLSVVTRSPRSKFTRVQRATACLVLVMSTMMVNLMFYGQSKHVESPQLIEFGPIKLTAHSIYLATVSSLIILPINVLIVVLFKNRRNKPKKASKSGAGDGEKYAIGEPSVATEEAAGKSLKSKVLARIRPAVRRVWPLPWWSYIIGYILSFLSVAACTYLMVEFGGVLGEAKTSEWLASMLVTLLQSIVLIQPVKIVVIAAAYALLVKKIDEDEDEVTKEMVAAGLPPVHERLSIKDLTDPSKREMFLKSKRAPPPPDEHVLRELREQRIREKNMNDILKDIVFYILFLVVLMMAAYTSQDYRSYLQNNYVKNMLTKGIYVQNETHQAKTMSSAIRRDSLWDYLNNTVIPTAYPIACYNGEFCNQIGLNWTSDPNLMLVRMAQLRQLRIKKAVDSCKISSYFANIISECRPEYSMWSDDERSFAPGWLLANSTTPVQPEWTYTDAMEMYGTPVGGTIATYSGGGYVASLGRNRYEARSKVTKLAKEGWLDVYTRGVFVEMLLYNPNTNLFTFCELLLEFHNGGSFLPDPMIFTLRMDRYVGANGMLYLALDIVSLIFIVVFLVKEIRALHKKKCSYFQDAFNVMDFVLLLVCCAEIGLFATRIVAQKAVSYLLRTYPNKFVNFQWLILWQQMNQLFMGLIVFIFTIRFLRLLTFNRKMRMLGCVLQKAVKPLLHFGVVFGIMFFAFVQMGYLMFFCNVESFKTPIATVETLGVMTLNKFDFTTFIVGGGNLGMIFFFFYMLFVSFILINFFLTIILESFSAVKADWANVSNEYEIVDYAVSCIRSLFGCKEAANKLHHIDTRFNYMQETSDGQQHLMVLDGKLDELELYICTAGIRLEEQQAKAIKANQEKILVYKFLCFNLLHLNFKLYNYYGSTDSNRRPSNPDRRTANTGWQCGWAGATSQRISSSLEESQPQEQQETVLLIGGKGSWRSQVRVLGNRRRSREKTQQQSQEKHSPKHSTSSKPTLSEQRRHIRYLACARSRHELEQKQQQQQRQCRIRRERIFQKQKERDELNETLPPRTDLMSRDLFHSGLSVEQKFERYLQLHCQGQQQQRCADGEEVRLDTGLEDQRLAGRQDPEVGLRVVGGHVTCRQKWKPNGGDKRNDESKYKRFLVLRILAGFLIVQVTSAFRTFSSRRLRLAAKRDRRSSASSLRLARSSASIALAACWDSFNCIFFDQLEPDRDDPDICEASLDSQSGSFNSQGGTGAAVGLKSRGRLPPGPVDESFCAVWPGRLPDQHKARPVLGVHQSFQSVPKSVGPRLRRQRLGRLLLNEFDFDAGFEACGCCCGCCEFEATAATWSAALSIKRTLQARLAPVTGNSSSWNCTRSFLAPPEICHWFAAQLYMMMPGSVSAWCSTPVSSWGLMRVSRSADAAAASAGSRHSLTATSGAPSDTENCTRSPTLPTRSSPTIDAGGRVVALAERLDGVELDGGGPTQAISTIRGSVEGDPVARSKAATAGQIGRAERQLDECAGVRALEAHLVDGGDSQLSGSFRWCVGSRSRVPISLRWSISAKVTLPAGSSTISVAVSLPLRLSCRLNSTGAPSGG
uniref:PLAT domain-containing protein n=1 Tax=Macrostomum lignano TaxID=282301 RepID=A0A1I8GBW5_9PLAT